MRRRATVTVILTGCFAGLACAATPACISDHAQLPENWRPSTEIRQRFESGPWRPAEAAAARRAVRVGLHELMAFYEANPSAVKVLWDDSVESLIQATHASANPPALDREIRRASRRNLEVLLTALRERQPVVEHTSCEDFEALLPLAILAHRLLPSADKRTLEITKRVNMGRKDCDGLADAIGFDHRRVIEDAADGPVDIERLFDLHLWSIWFVEAGHWPRIELPAAARTFSQAAWAFLSDLPLAEEGRFKGNGSNEKFIALADLASHIAHIPTGVHRFVLRREDAPGLYRFHRENFYAVMSSGEIDVFASFVDTLRQYGCTPENDAQVRDGTRFLLQVFDRNGSRWMDYLEDGKLDRKAQTDDYDLIHLAWTAALGLRHRLPAAHDRGFQGHAWRQSLGMPD